MKRIILLLGFMFVFQFLNAQIGIGTLNPDQSAIVELESNSKGFLLPRLTTIQRDLIVDPANGLMIYNSDHSCIEIYSNSILFWEPLCSSVEAIKNLSVTNAPSCGTSAVSYASYNGKKYPVIDDTYTSGSLNNNYGEVDEVLVKNQSGVSSSSKYFRIAFLKYDLSDWTSGTVDIVMKFASTSNITNMRGLLLTADATSNWDEHTLTGATVDALDGITRSQAHSNTYLSANQLTSSISGSTLTFSISESDIIANKNTKGEISILVARRPSSSSAVQSIYSKENITISASFTGTNAGAEAPYELVHKETGNILKTGITNTANNFTFNPIYLPHDPSVTSMDYTVFLRSIAHPKIRSNEQVISIPYCF